jgi:GntR family transcriptional regulator of arabinose operon
MIAVCYAQTRIEQIMPIALDRSAAALPLHEQIAAILKERITGGLWPSGSGLPSEKALCAEFDVSRGTVRQALQTLENEGMLRREQGRGTFVHFNNTSADTTQARRMAFIVPYVRDSSVPTILVGFQQVAEENNFSVIFNYVNNDPDQQERVIQKLVGENVAGIALYPVDSEDITIVDTLRRVRFPIVMIDRYLRGISTDYVMSDHFGGAIRSTHYLFDLGHTRVGFVTWLSPAVSLEHRLLGYTQALAERRAPLAERLICRVNGYPIVDVSPLHTYLQGADRPTAILAANDQIAAGIYRAASSIGLRIPDDVSVMGFDNLDLSPHLDPPLTTMAQPFLQIGQTAANLLLRRVGGDHERVEQITLPTELIIRSSCRHWPADERIPARSD